MNKLALFIALTGAFLGVVSQFMLKLAANKKYKNGLQQYFNPLVIGAYLLLLIITMANLYSLKFIPISLMPLIEATSYVHVAVIAYFFLKESISPKKLLGLCLIIIGLIIASI
ncbi:MAG: EamA family transporter [Christensenellaceae bacterium]|nr:EamA family transporter [Christensenellaceae bacterium]